MAQTLKKVLIFGRGWIGEKFHRTLENSVLSAVDITNEKAVREEIDRVAPDCILNCAGKTGRPSIDSCEKDLSGTLRSNVLGPLVLALTAAAKGLYMVHLGSGCIYNGDNGGRGYAESDPPNFFGSLYSRSKIMAENSLKEFPVLQLRLRLPMCGEPSPRNLISKLVSYRQVIRIANSVTVIEDLLPVALELMKQKQTGIFNVVNEGLEYHDELLDLYRQIVDPTFNYSVMPLSDLSTRVSAPRSNCQLSTQKLKDFGLALPPITTSLKKILTVYADKLRERSERE